MQFLSTMIYNTAAVTMLGALVGVLFSSNGPQWLDKSLALFVLTYSFSVIAGPEITRNFTVPDPSTPFLLPVICALWGHHYYSRGTADLPPFVVAYFLLRSGLPFVKNAIAAHRTGLPSITVFWHPHTFIWMVLSVPLRPTLRRLLPSFVWNRLSVTVYGWEYEERFRPFVEHAAPQGDAKSFFLVSCGEQELYTWDSQIAKQVLSRNHDFHQGALVELFLSAFGKSVFTSNGQSWARQRKIVAAVVNERISKTVFSESIRQTEGLVHEVSGPGNPAVTGSHNEARQTNRVFDMIKEITINVLSGAGMGIAVPWGGAGDDVMMPTKPGFKTDYMSACKIVVAATMGPILLPLWFLGNYPRWMPGYEYMRDLFHAKREFPVHTADMLNSERQRQRLIGAAKGTGTSGNIMSQLLQHAMTEKNPTGLTDHELSGNLFIFTVAGFETTANTLSYTIMLLCRHPEWQAWLCEQIDDVLPDATASTGEEDYPALYHQCTRLLALMLETLRLFPPLVHIVKETRGEQTLTTAQGKTFTVQDGMLIYVNSVLLHLDPETYRNINIDTSRGETPSDDDEMKFRPTRWLNQDPSSPVMFQPPKGKFIPWSMGPRSCPGQRMSQVEFTAVMLTLLKRHSIEAVLEEGETRAQAEQRMDGWMKNSFSKATLEMSGIYGIEGEEGGFRIGMRQRRWEKTHNTAL